MTSPTHRYGNSPLSRDDGDLPHQEVMRAGYTVLKGILNEGQLEYCRDAIDRLVVSQCEGFSATALASVGELDLVRSPLVDDDFFLFSVARASLVRQIVESVIGSYCLLHLQNAVINRPDRGHHQSAWHRDLPYLDRTCSSPLAVSALLCVDTFSIDSGCTWCLPGSHRVAGAPSDEFLARHAVAVEADAGDVILFDSMMFHRAGVNTSSFPRRAVNNVYSVGIIRQQIDLPRALGGRFSDDPELAIFLGYSSNAPVSAYEYRKQRLSRLDPA